MRALCDTLEYEGYKTYGFTAPAEALAAMRERSYDLLLADLQMPGTNGIDLMKSAQLIDPTLVAVIMTGHGALETAIAAMKAGALDYIQKPIKLATTLPVLERALAVRQLRIEKKRLEENVRERTEELKIANRELEAFSYSVSHDLRAPLRAVSVFTQSLLSDHAGALSDEGRRLLQNVNAGAAHMDRLITDLLRLSQLNRQALHKQPVRFGEVARKVIDDMANERAGRDIEFVIADFPTWQVDPGLMQQVFVNLISNAIKFTREREKARIEIGYRMDGTHAGVLREGQRRGLQHEVHEQVVRRVPAPAQRRSVRRHGRRAVHRAPYCRTSRGQGLGRRRAGPGRGVLLQPAGLLKLPCRNTEQTAAGSDSPGPMRRAIMRVMNDAVLPSTDERVPRATSAFVNDRIQARTLHDVSRFIGADPVFIDERIQSSCSANGTSSERSKRMRHRYRCWASCSDCSSTAASSCCRPPWPRSCSSTPCRAGALRCHCCGGWAFALPPRSTTRSSRCESCAAIFSSA